MKISGQVAVVTGGAQGLGRAFTEALLKEGAKVVIGDINEDQGAKTVQELEAQYGEGAIKFVQVDISQEGQFKELYKKAEEMLSTPSIVINNAGIMDEANWRKMVNINLNGVIEGCLEGMRGMSKSTGGPGGVILNVSSIAGLRVIPCEPIYGTTKAAVVHLTKQVGCQEFYDRHGVRVNCICPGALNTELMKTTLKTEQEFYFPDPPPPKKRVLMIPAYLVSEAMRLLEDDTINGAIFRVEANDKEWVNKDETSNKNMTSQAEVTSK